MPTRFSSAYAVAGTLLLAGGALAYIFLKPGKSPERPPIIGTPIALPDVDASTPPRKTAPVLSHATELDIPHNADDAMFKRLMEGRTNWLRFECHSPNMNDAWMEVIAACPDLEKFHNVGTNPANLSSEGMALLARRTTLKILGLCSQQTISDKDFAAILRANPNLMFINLCDSGDSRVGAESIAEVAKLSGLTTFIIRGLAPGVRGGTLLAALEGKPLASVMLHGVDLDDEALASLGAFPSLRYLILGNATGVTDAGVRIIVENCQSVMNLSIGSSTRLTDEALELLAECGSLRMLSVNPRGMTAKGVEAFRRRRPDVNLHLTAPVNPASEPVAAPLVVRVRPARPPVVEASEEDVARWRAEVEEYRRKARERDERLDWTEFAPPDIPRGREIHEKVMAFVEVQNAVGQTPMAVHNAYAGNEDGWRHEFDREAMGDFLDSRAALFVLLDEILASPRATSPFDAELEEAFSVELPHLVAPREMSRLLAARVRYIAETEGVNQGLDALAHAIPLAGLYQDDPFLVSGLLGIALQAIPVGLARHFAAASDGTADPEAIRRLARVIAETKATPSLSRVMEAERASLALPLMSDAVWQRFVSDTEMMESLFEIGEGEGAKDRNDIALRIPLSSRWENYAGVYRYFDRLMPVFARLERDWDNREAWDEFNRLEWEMGKLPLVIEQEYGPYAALLTPALARTAIMYARAEATRRLTAFGLNLWADALEGKPLSETPPLNPLTGNPILMKRTDDRVTLRVGGVEDEQPVHPNARPWEVVMTIRLQPAPVHNDD